MDRSLDEIVAESQQNKRGSRPRRGGGGGGRPRERDAYPRDGVRKSTRDDSRNLDAEWVHDRFDEPQSRNRQRFPRRERSLEQPRDIREATKLKMENLHYELTEDDLYSLFDNIGPVRKLDLLYDRAGRSEGVAYVTFENARDAQKAYNKCDNANARGQPIYVTLLEDGPQRGPRGPPRQGRNPFDTAHMPGRSLAERITRPRSYSPRRVSDKDRNVDRYVPGNKARSRSPLPRRRGGRRAGARREGREAREGDGNAANGRERTGRDGRPKKTQEELDAEMADYFNPGASNEAAQGAETAAQAGDEMDMIE
ncbi:RNA-binding domain-containing protein [Hypoxylon sp. FL1150]|nr:RNA-binding domain-containing protein [Hypoxylon sp. FL1150]